MEILFGSFRARAVQAFAELRVADAVAASILGSAHYRAWTHLPQAVTKGTCVFDTVLGENVWTYSTSTNPAEGRIFNQAMAGSSAATAHNLLAHYDFPAEGHFIGGDFFESVPSGGDLYMIKWILPDWSDEKAGQILRSAHGAMPDHACLLLIEAVVTPGAPDEQSGRLPDLNMMVMCGGKERTAAQWEALLTASGFSISRITPMPGLHSIVEAKKQ